MQFQERFNNLASNLRKEKIAFRRNVSACCGGCVDAKKLGLKNESDPILWHFGGQGMAFEMWGNTVQYKKHSWNRGELDTIFLNHDNLHDGNKLNENGKRVVKLLIESGLSWEWQNFSPYSCIEIKVKETIGATND